MSTDIVIVAAARTAAGKFGGTLAETPASELGAAVIADLLKRAMLSGDQIGEVILGQESMRMAPHALPGSRDGTRMGDWTPVDTMIVDGLWVGVTAPARIASYASAGLDPGTMGMGPAPASQRAQQRAG